MGVDFNILYQRKNCTNLEMPTTMKTVQRYVYRHKGIIFIFFICMFIRQNLIDKEEDGWFEMARHGIEEMEDYVDNVQLIPEHIDTEVHHHIGGAEEANKLASEIKIVCFILTYPGDKKATHVKETWGKKCNKLLFLSSEDDAELGAVDMHVGEGRNILWGKSRAAFKYVYDHYLEDYHWFFKGDTDTFVIMENMRYMLSPYDPSFPVYFGSRFKKFTPQGYMSGGGGYVLSREAVKLFVEKALPDNKLCKQQPTGAEDAEMGKCLDHIGVLAGDSRDDRGRGRMFPFTPATHLLGGVPKWYKDYVYYLPDTGLNCCSDRPVTFHYVNTEKQHEFHYFLYHARIYGIGQKDDFPAPLPLDKKSIPKPVLEKYGKSSQEEINI